MSATIDFNDPSPDRNMYGCMPCPQCGGHHRYGWRGNGPLQVACDDCGLYEPAAMVGGEEDDKSLDSEV